LLLAGLLQTFVYSDTRASVGHHRVPSIEATVRVCSRLPQPLEYILLRGDLSVRELPRGLPFFLDDSGLTVFGQVSVRSLVLAGLLTDNHGVLDCALVFGSLRLDVDVFLIDVVILQVPGRTVDDARLGDSRVIPEQRLLRFDRLIRLDVRNVSPVEFSRRSLTHVLARRWLHAYKVVHGNAVALRVLCRGVSVDSRSVEETRGLTEQRQGELLPFLL